MAVSKNTIVITSKGPKGEKGAAVTVDGAAITSFSTVSVTDDASSVVADSANDTVIFSGGGATTLSSSGSTVTISSTDTDTTYTLDTAQDGDNATITLTGSDASTDSITLAAGSNVTLTETGDTITIASTGGGGGGSVTVYDDSSLLTSALSSFNFTGSGVTLTEVSADNITVDIPNGANSFGNVVVGAVTVAADSYGDTLTLTTAAASAVALTGIEVSDTISIDAYIQNETDPTLGAGLDVKTYPIYTTTTNGNVFVYGNGTGVVSLGSNTVNNNVNCSPGLVEVRNDGTDQSKVKLYCENETHYVQLKAPAHSGTFVSYDFVLPETAGTSGQFLQTDGSGNTTWAAAGSATILDGQKLEYVVSSTALTSAGDYEGLVLKVGDAGNTLTAGTVYYFDAAQTDWVAASNAAEATAKGVLGIALGTSGTADGVLIQGVYYYADAAGVTGDVLFLGTAGAMTATAPTTDGEILRVLGQNIDDNIVMFQPSQDFIELGAAAGVTSIDDLSDVDTTTVAPTNGQALVWDSAASQWEPGTVSGGSSDLDGLSDVTITGTPGAGELLINNATSGQFVNATLTAGNFVKISNTDGAIEIAAGDGAEVEYRSLAAAVANPGEVEGSILKFGSTTGLTAGSVYVWNGTDWVAVDADAEATTKGLMGVALGTAATDGFLTHGTAYLSHDPGAAGDILYVSATAGQLTSTQPIASTQFVRVAGYCLADNKIFFSPSQDWIEIA